MKNNEVPEGESDNPKGDPDDETSGEDTLETDGGGEALEGTSDPSKGMSRKKQMTLAEFGSARVASVTILSNSW